MNVQLIIQNFVSDLSAAVREELSDAITAAMSPMTIDTSRSDVNTLRRPTVGRAVISNFKAAKVSAPKTARKKGPIQLCPVPGCKGRAAPSLGMVCSDHRDVAKSKIKKYREARRAAKK